MHANEWEEMNVNRVKNNVFRDCEMILESSIFIIVESFMCFPVDITMEPKHVKSWGLDSPILILIRKTKVSPFLFLYHVCIISSSTCYVSCLYHFFFYVLCIISSLSYLYHFFFYIHVCIIFFFYVSFYGNKSFYKIFWLGMFPFGDAKIGCSLVLINCL